MSDDLQYIDNLVKDSIGNIRMESNPDAWSKLESKINSSPGLNLFNGKTIFTTIGVALLIVAGAVIGLNRTEKNTESGISEEIQPADTFVLPVGTSENETINRVISTKSEQKRLATRENEIIVKTPDTNTQAVLIITSSLNDELSRNQIAQKESIAVKRTYSADENLNVAENTTPISDYSNSSKGCVPYTVNFKAKTRYAVSYFWDFDDGNSSTEETPDYTFENPGTYIVKLKAVNTEGKQSFVRYDTIVVFPLPSAEIFTSSDSVIIPGEALLCKCKSKDAVNYLWSFGDGSISTNRNAEHYYKESGNYPVSLTVQSKDGCSDQFLKDKEITAITYIKFPNVFTPNKSGSVGGYYSMNDNTNDVFYPVHENVAEYQLVIYSRWGEMIFRSNDINRGWDGYYNGSLCSEGVYIYEVSGKYLNGESFRKIDNVTIRQ